MSIPPFLIVEKLVPAAGHVEDVRERVWSYALDQRAFGPRKLWTMFADADGRFRGLAYTDRTDPPLISLEACLDSMAAGAAAAIVFCDEPVTDPPPPETVERFEAARGITAYFGVRLVDWFSCDDDAFWPVRLRTMRPAEQPDWWDV